MSSTTDEVLAQRGERYGSFRSNAITSQMLKNVLKESNNWLTMDYYQREALEMICHKMARIVNGDPDYTDSWVDIAGYATLVVKMLEE